MPQSRTVYFNFKQPNDVLFQPHWSQPYHIVQGETNQELQERLKQRPRVKVRIETICGHIYTYNALSTLTTTPTKKRKCCEACIIEAMSYDPERYRARWDDDLPF